MKQLSFTFGIITTTNTCQFIPYILDSIFQIQNLQENDFEIIIIGGPILEKHKLIKHIEFDETPKISVKKNIITEHSTKENIVFLHDYFAFNKSWYNGYLNFGNDWDVCMNVILNKDGSRFRDWVMWDDKPNITLNGHRGLLAPYSYSNVDRMYISGGYWVAKRKIMIDNPLNKHLEWADCEDLEWSKRVIRNHSYKMNTNSSVHILKPNKPTVFNHYIENL